MPEKNLDFIISSPEKKIFTWTNGIKKRDKFNYNNNHHTWNRISKSKPVGVSSTTKNGKKFHLDFFFIFLAMKKIYVNIRISWDSIRNDFDKNLSHTFLWWLAIFLDFFFFEWNEQKWRKKIHLDNHQFWLIDQMFLNSCKF